MTIDVHLHTTLQQQTPGGLIGRLAVALSEGSTLKDLMVALDLNVSEENTLLVVNGKLAEADCVLQDGDEVHFIPALSGGD